MRSTQSISRRNRQTRAWRLVDAEGLEHADRLLPVRGSRAVLRSAVERVADRPAAPLEAARGRAGRRRAGARGWSSSVRWLPPVGRVRTTIPGRAARDALVEPREHRQRLVGRPRAGRGLEGSSAPDAPRAPLGLDVETERGEPVAVAAVDRLLRRPERCDRLLALADVGELRLHHPAQQPSASMRREHADERSRRRTAAEPPGTVIAKGRPLRPRRSRPSSKPRACARTAGAVEKRVASSSVGSQPK